MTTALAVTSHGHILPPPDHHTPRAHLFSPPDRQPFDAALAETHALIEAHGYVVAVYPASLPIPFLHRLHAIRSLLESDRIALLPTELPPLAVGVLVRQLRQLSLCDFSPGVLGSAVRLLTHYLYAGALLNSVAKLDRIPVSLTAHAKSWVPGAQFGVLAAPRPQLVRVSGSSGSGGDRGVPAGPDYTTRLTVARGNLTSDWVNRTLARRWRVGEIQEAQLPEDSAQWWGTGRLIEFTAAIPDISVLYQLVASVRRDDCRWCGLELIGDRCAFCSASVGPPTAARSLPAGAEGSRPPSAAPPSATPPSDAPSAATPYAARPAGAQPATVHQGVPRP